MKIVMVLRSLRSGGAENHVLMLMQALRAAGHDVHYAGPAHGWLGQQLTRAGFAVFDLPMRGMYDLLSIWRLSRYARRMGADILHGHLTRGAFYAGWASWLSGIASVATAHSDNAGKHFGRARKIIAVSHAVGHFLQTCGYEAGRIRVVHHGIPDPLKSKIHTPVQGASAGKSDRFTLLMVARLVPAKGHDTALQALAKLKHLPLRLRIAGDHAAGIGPQIQNLCRQLGLDECVEFLGHRTDITELMLNADLLLAPSRREALSLTLIEAAACGLPVIASRVGGIPEVVQDGVTGWLVPPDDHVALSECIEQALDHPERLQHMGQEGRRTFEAAFTENAMIDATLAVYRSATAQHDHA
ncbi:MAG: glycosyltransferase family 4 protein [Limnohabitans sp.]